MAEEHVNEVQAKKKSEPKLKAKMLLSQYYHWYRPDVHIYTQAYVKARYGDTLKTKKEWDKELEKGI